MYFGIAPKTEREDFFDFEKEQEELLNAIKGPHRLIVIRGLRRVGKTSLMNVAYNQLKNPKAFVDARELELGRKAAYNHFGMVFYKFLHDVSIKEKIKSYVTGLDAYVTISFQKREALSELAKRINEIMKNRNDFFCLFIDEAQLLKPTGLDRFFAYLYDRADRIKIILAGSEVGLLDRFMGMEPATPLYGRVKKLIELKRFSQEKTLAFLKAGFKEAGIKPKDEELEEAISKLDGIVGWLAAYGFYRQEMPHMNALKKTISEGAKMTGAELEGFLSNRVAGRKRYLATLTLLSKTPASWGEIKNVIAAKTGKAIPDSRLASLLDQLTEYGFIEKKEDAYHLADPLIGVAIKLLTGR